MLYGYLGKHYGKKFFKKISKNDEGKISYFTHYLDVQKIQPPLQKFNNCLINNYFSQEYFNKSNAWTTTNIDHHAYDLHENNEIFKETETYSMVVIELIKKLQLQITLNSYF